VLPTRVGVNRGILTAVLRRWRAPHISGGEPNEENTDITTYEKLPTCVGVNRCCRSFPIWRWRAPHPRGGEPNYVWGSFITA